MAILWKKDLGGYKILDPDDSRIMCLEFSHDNNLILYDFLYYLSKVNSIIENHPTSHACIMGDFSAKTIEGR